MNKISQAKVELAEAWSVVQATEASGLAFGKICYAWSIELGETLYPIYKDLGIRPTDANWWMEKYKTSIGLKELHKEKRPNRSSPNTFSEIQQTALDILQEGFKNLIASKPEKTRLFQSAKDWAFARLTRNDL